MAEVVIVPPVGPVTIPPPKPFLTWCDYAQDGLRRALDGLVDTSAGVQGYGIGSRNITFRTAGEQAVAVDYWQRMVDRFCGVETASLTGRDTAFRVVPRDV